MDEKIVFEEMRAALYDEDWDGVKKLFKTYGIHVFLERRKEIFKIMGCGIVTFLISAEQLELLQILLENGWDINRTNEEGEDTLYAAIAHGNEETLVYLLENGLDVNHQNNQGETGLMTAFQLERFEKAEILYQYGADINICDHNKRNALYYLFMERDKEKEWIELLLKQPERLSEENIKVVKAKRLEYVYG